MVKKLVGKIHLWLGLSVGLIVVFLGITGCMLAFQREIESITHTYDYVKAENKEFLQPSQLGKIAQAILPDKMLHSVTYGEKDRSAQVAFYQFEPSYYYIVYINPYRGEVLKVKDMDRDFFRILIDGHFYLWLPPHIGQPIVATATLIFVVMMITGIILWWPRNKAARKQRFTIKWNARWRRVNYDLHNVFGFYMSWVAIFIALTGLVFGFQCFAKAVYWTTSGGKQLTEFYEPTAGKANVSNDLPAIDRIYHKMKAEYATAETIEVHYPINDSVAIGAGANPDADTYWKIDYRWFDQRTLQEVEVKHLYGRFTTASTADKIARMNYDLHVGAIGGITTKIIAFFASLIAASLPITGFYIWWGRRKKKLSSKQQGLSNVELKPLQAV
jgi:uncharacterized iron-regulated membrane protein